MGEGFSLIESDFPEIPSLIYDGPFSQHIQDMKPLYLENKDIIDASQAYEKACDFTGYDSFELLCEREGNLPSYCFSVKTDDGTISVDITKHGGEVLSIYSSHQNAENNIITPESAVHLATDYLTDHGYDSMKESYWSIIGNTVLVNFAYEQDGILCYPDLIKVAVSLSSGKVCGFEALGYIMNHTQRKLPDIKISTEDAVAKVPDSLSLQSHSLAIIPTDGKYELLCHEFKCQSTDGRHYIIYVNAESGEQEKILLLIESENGTLTI